MVILTAKLGDRFENLLLLVDLDRENTLVFPGIANFLNNFAERVVKPFDLRAKNIFNAQEDRHCHSPLFKSSRNFVEAYPGTVIKAQWCCDNIT